ncbi:hypothetical protein IFVP5_C1110003 [Vibrio parahaemolyticus]
MSHMCDGFTTKPTQPQERIKIDYGNAQTLTHIAFTDSDYQRNIFNYHRTCYSPFCLKFQRNGAGWRTI